MKRKFTSLIVLILMVAGIKAADVDVSGTLTGTVNWTKDNNYYLDGYVYVADGAVLNIEPGTVVRGYAGSVENASALIVKRGGKINAIGTVDEPVIFTSEADQDLTRPNTFRGEWGGVIILGRGTHSNLTDDNGIEGVPSSEEAYYGGNIKDDNSGTLRYVSIRHAGVELAADEEINGLTLGAVGSGTTIEFVEVTSNDDDGVEFFGGSVNCRYMIVTDCADESYDTDEGYDGYLQFIYTGQMGDGTGDNFGEHDGGPGSNLYGTPLSKIIISNATYVGGGAASGDRTLTLKEYFAGSFYNSIFAEQAKGIRIMYRNDFENGAKGGAFANWKNGIIKIENNIFQNIADGTAAGIFTVYSVTDSEGNPIYTIPADSGNAFASYGAEKNIIADAGVSKTNPVPTQNVSGASFTGLPSWFKEVNYKGAFDPSVSNGHWGGTWSSSFASVNYSDPVTGIYRSVQKSFEAFIYPNPVADEARIEFNNAASGNYTLTIYSIDGRLVRNIRDIKNNSVVFSRENLPSGIYTFRLTDGEQFSTGKLLLK